MKNKKVFHVRLTKTGKTYPVTLQFSKYTVNDKLAVQLIDAAAPWSPFATLTVNLSDPRQNDTLAFVDTNNCPWAEEFLADNHIAENTGISMPSGFCMYPLYKFNKESQWE